MGVWLGTALDLTLVETALDTNREGVWGLYLDGTCMRGGRLDLTEMSGAHRFGDLDDLVNSDITKCDISNVRWESEDCIEKRVIQLVNWLGSLTTYTSGQWRRYQGRHCSDQLQR